MSLEDFTERTGIPLEDGDYETVAGFIMARLARVAVVGDRVPVGDTVLEVAAMAGHRVTRIILRPTAQPE